MDSGRTAIGFSEDFWLMGPTAGPGSTVNGSGSKHSRGDVCSNLAPDSKLKAHSSALCACGVSRKTIKR
jgi:hypothetical protein